MTEIDKILIISNFFYPEITPRAFRTTELVRELTRRGKKVTLILPNREIYRKNELAIEGLTVLYGDAPMQFAVNGQVRRSAGSRLPKWIQNIILYFYAHELLAKYDASLLRTALKIQEKQDMIISISYPCAIHWVTERAVCKNPYLSDAIKVAEFSDPPMRDSRGRFVFPLYNLYLKRWGRLFDYFVIPTEKSISCYDRFMDRDRIKIIPQGFDFSKQKRQTYRSHAVPTFAYAGRFYEHIRNPRYFLDYLRNVEGKFCFDMYLINLDDYFNDMIRCAADEIKGEINILEALPREALIERLSGYDFLINFDNTTSNAQPSKLIDYAIASRPILSFNENTFDRELFTRFLSGDYDGGVKVDLAPFDIRNVVSQFLALDKRIR